MENSKVGYVGKVGNNIPKDVKEYVMKRVKEGGKSVAEIAKEHGIGKTAIYKWLKEETGGSDSLVFKLQKENQLLKQLVAELSLKIRETEKRGW
jgi:transposase-like protein